MRKIILAAIGTLMLMQLAPANAADSVTGKVLLPTPIVGSGEAGTIGAFDCDWVTNPDCEKGSFAGLHRRLYLVNASAAQGKFGYTFPVTAAGVPFNLRSEPAGTADFDISFYVNLGALPNTNPTPYCAAPCTPPKSSFNKLNNNGESGTVPAGTNFAIVTCTCADSTFVYTAG